MNNFLPCHLCGSPFLCSANKECHIGPVVPSSTSNTSIELASAKQRIEQLENAIKSWGYPLP